MGTRKALLLIAPLLLAMLSFSSIILPAQANDRTRITAPVIVNPSLGPGSNLNLTIRVLNLGPVPEDLDAWQVRLRLDPAILKITRLFPGPILHQRADDFGGNVLDTLQFNATAGTVDANELLDLTGGGNPQSENAGWTGTVGDLLYVQVQVLTLGVSNITITQDPVTGLCNRSPCIQLNDIDGTTSTRIQPLGCFTPRACDGVFANIPYNVPPVASFRYSPPAGVLGQNVTFDASASLNRDNDTIVQYAWDFGDGTPIVQTANPILNYTFTQVGGPFTVRLNVTDNGNPPRSAIFSRSDLFVTGTSHPPVAILEYYPQNPKPGEVVTFNATKSRDQDGDLLPPPTAIRVPFLFNFGDNKTGGSKTGVVTHVYDVPGNYTVTLTATDNNHLSASNTTLVTVAGNVTRPKTESLPPWVIPSVAGVVVAGLVAAVVFRRRRRGRATEQEAEDDFL